MNDILTPIRTARRALHLTQQDVANQLGMTRETYSRIESGRCSTTLETMKRICNLLNLDIAIKKRDL